MSVINDVVGMIVCNLAM